MEIHILAHSQELQNGNYIDKQGVAVLATELAQEKTG